MSQVNHTPYRDLHLLPIAGAWREGSAPQSLQVSDPYNGETLLQIKQATRDDLDEAYQAAQRAQVEWAMIGPGQRSAILHRAVQIFDERREEIIGWIIRESGSTRIKAQIEWGAARSITLESASFPARVHGRILPSNVPGKENRVYREPLGVVGVISPWNFPLHLTQRSVAPALALGNAVVIKPASDTPVTGGLLAARIFEEAGVPAGVISVLVGSGAEIGDAFVERYAERVKALKVGDPSEPDTVVGPIINRKQLDTLLSKVARAREEGARPVVEGDVRGQLLPPHVFADVTAEMEITREEIFGPLVGIQRARDEAHALALANDSEFGLSSAVFTADLERGARFARRIKAGMTHVNDIPVNDEAHAPFGGEKNSGLGRFNGEWAIEEFTTDHWISVQMTPRKYPF